MSKTALCGCALVALLSACFSATKAGEHRVLPAPMKSGADRQTDAPDDVIFFDDFETGAPGWTFVDLTAVNAWHTDAFNAYGGSGASWWCGTTELGGYDNNWLQYLESPSLDLTGATSPVLTFNLFYAVEPYVANPPYDAWDGGNIWVSTNGGGQWEVLSVSTPPYNASSIYGFGEIWGMGPNIPGWSGFSGATGSWLNASASLAGHTSANTRIRFAFASDNLGSSADDSSFLGMFVDNIIIQSGSTQYLSNNAEGVALPAQLTPALSQPPVGNLWHVETITIPSPPTPTHVMSLATADNTYLPLTYNALVSPPLDLTYFDPNSDSLYLDFYHAGALNIGDTDLFPELDFWTVQVSPDNVHWYYWSNPWADPFGFNYVMAEAPATFALFSQLWGLTEWGIDLTPYISNTVRIRILFQAESDVFTGSGLMVDDFQINHFGPTGVRPAEPGVYPEGFALYQNAPNPFNGETTISFAVPQAGSVRLAVWNAQGREVRRLEDGLLSAGAYQVDFVAGDLPSGIYIYRLEAEGASLQRKMVLLR